MFSGTLGAAFPTRADHEPKEDIEFLAQASISQPTGPSPPGEPTGHTRPCAVQVLNMMELMPESTGRKSDDTARVGCALE